MKRIIDANLNRATEALRVIEEIARFSLEDEFLCRKMKFLRHKISSVIDQNYKELLKNRNTPEDVGIKTENPSSRKNIEDIFKANFKRLEQALRVLAEYSQVEGISSEGIKTFENARYEVYTLEKDMFKELTKKLNRKKLESKKLYLVTDRSRFNSEDEFLDAVASSLKGGVGIVQLREKTTCAKEFINLAKKVKELCSVYDALFIINDRVDIAHIVNADGVHLGQDDVDIHSARHILGAESIIGISTHAHEQAMKAIQDGADYIGVGPVFETPTKPGRKSVGLDYVKWAFQNVAIPWFAIGGIDEENVLEVIKAGALRLAFVRAVINDKNPAASASKFLGLIEQTKL